MIFAANDRLPAEVRQIYGARKGQSDPRAVIGLANFRHSIKQRYESQATPEQMLVIMYKVFLAMLSEEPLRLSDHVAATNAQPKVENRENVQAQKVEATQQDYRSLVLGAPISDDGIAKLLSIYLQSLGPKDACDISKSELPEEAKIIELAFVEKLFRAFDHFLFEKLIVPQISASDEIRKLFPSDDNEYLKGIALIIAQVAFDQPPDEPRRILHEGHVLMTLHQDVATEIKHEYTANQDRPLDPRGLVALPVFRFFAARRLDTGWEQPMLVMLMHSVMTEWLQESPITMPEN